MPVMKLPGSDPDRRVFIEAAANTSKKDFAAGKKYLREETYSDLQSFYPVYNSTVGMVDSTKSVYSKELGEKNTAISKLEQFCRDTWDAVYRQAIRKKLSAQVFTLYGMNLDGTIPAVKSPNEWLFRGDTILNGDAEAAKQGYPVCPAPTATEIKVELDAARKETDESNSADSTYQESEKDAAALRTKADELIDQVTAELDTFLRKLKPAQRRRKMRLYGVKYVYLKGEPEDLPEEDNAAQPQPEPAAAMS